MWAWVALIVGPVFGLALLVGGVADRAPTIVLAGIALLGWAGWGGRRVVRGVRRSD